MESERATSGGPDAIFAAALASGRFMIQHCEACCRHIFYPRVLCPHCGGARLEWVESSGAGTVYSTSTVRRREDLGGDYNVVLVDLDEGPRLMSRIETIASKEVRIGMRVVARIVEDTRSEKVLVFVPTDGDRK